MNVAEIAIHPPAERRRVGIEYETHTWVMWDAVRIYTNLGIDVDVTGDVVSLLVPEPAALFFAGMFERFTGRVAFNEWL